jgi:glycosyltransferase involved in cell wall biosynthesis
MKILIIHNTYQIKGGEDAVVESEVELLRQHGHEVELAVFDNNDIKGFWSKISTTLQLIYSYRTKNILQPIINRMKPDIVHVHNFFPLVTPSVYDVADRNNIPVVQTLHNFRILCPNGLFLLKGNVCERCIDGAFYHSIINRCYRKSLLGSSAVAAFDYYHRIQGVWNNKVTGFIALTEFSKSKFIRGGIASHKIMVKPNFVESSPIANEKENFGLYVGRLSEEKGINVLAEALKNTSFPIKIVGEGCSDLLAQLNNVEYLGRKSNLEVVDLMQRALFLVVPSICYENFPRTIVEAFSNRLAVIGSNHGSIKEIISDNQNGLLFKAGDAKDLRKKMEFSFNNPDVMNQLGINAFNNYNRLYTSEENYYQLLAIYKSSINFLDK